ncbi:MAG: TonB-dependent receptor [Nitrospirota bacterium]
MRCFLLILLSVVLSCSIVFAEEAKKLEEVVVTATRTERTTEEIPAGVSVVTKEDIKDMRMFGVREALTGIAGVQSETKNGGYDARLIIRGAGLKARYGIREIMVLLDGVPLTDPDGMTNLDRVDTQLVDRVDVVKGPNSTLYGANAAGGVINIITKNPFEEIKSVKIGYGSDNTQLYNLIYGTSFGGKTYITLSGSRRSTDSWRAWNEFSTNQAGLKLGHMFDDKTLLEANISYTKSDFQLPGVLTKPQFDSDITQLTSERWRHSGRYSEVLNTSLKFEKEIGNVKLKPLAYFQSWHHYHPVTAFINDGGANVYGADIQLDIKHKIAGMEGVLTAGITGQIDEASGDKYTYRDVFPSTARYPSTATLEYTLSDEKDALAEKSSDTTTKWGIYLQESIRPSDKWIIDLGVRYDEVGFDISTDTYIKYRYAPPGAPNRYYASTETIRRDKTFDYVSPRAGVVYKLSKIFNLYGNISTGFQTPQSSELSTSSDLNPSVTTNYEAGVKARFDGGHSFDLSLFHAIVDDEIVQIRQPDTSTTYSNAGETRKRGVELSGRAQVLKGLFLGGSYTYSDFKFVKFTEVISGVNRSRDDNRYPYIPMHQYSLYAYYKHPSGFKFKVDTYTWGKYFVDNANSDTYKGYTFLTNALIGYEMKNFDITFDVNNVFDKRYAMEVTKETDLKYRPGAPMSMMGRITYKF